MEKPGPCGASLQGGALVSKRSLVTWVVVFAALMLAVPAGAAPIAPGAVPIKGDVIQLGTLFHVDYWNIRITSIAWEPATSPLGQKLDVDDDKGLLVFTADIKVSSDKPQEMMLPSIQVIYKDGTQSSDDNRTAYRADTAAEQGQGPYQPGQGLTVRFAIPNASKPTAANPVIKVLIKPYNGGDNDSGAAKVFRFLDPPIK